VRFECDFDLDPKVRDMYFGAYEPDEVAVVRRILKPGDVCVDAGANIGFFTAVAASRVGARGAVIAFEPVAEYFARLEALRDANPGFPIRVHSHGLGEREGSAEIRITAERNIGWNTMVPGLLAEADARAGCPCAGSTPASPSTVSRASRWSRWTSRVSSCPCCAG